MWQRFTERARRVVFFAQEEAGRLGENYVSTEHLLLGIVREKDCVAVKVLDRLGVSRSSVRAEVEKQITKGDGALGRDMQLTPRAKRVIDLAYDEARTLNNNYIGSEHLLLGLVREGDGLAGQILSKLGVDIFEARRVVEAMQDGRRGQAPGAEPTAKPESVADIQRASQLQGRDLLSIADLTKDELELVFSTTSLLKETPKKGVSHSDLLRDKTLAMIYEKPSLRTRVTFEVAMTQLGGHAIYLQPSDIQLGVRETIADAARNLERWVDVIMARVFSHDTVTELARYARIPVINALSDLEHPCQALADFYTIKERKGELKGLKLAFVGDGNNVCHSLMLLAAQVGTNLTAACPEGYEPDKDILVNAKALAEATGAAIEVTRDPVEAVKDADVVCTDVWASMGQESEKAEREKIFPPYQINAQLLAQAKKDVIFLHCLPAHRGEEVTDEVMDGPHSVVFDEAENRLHVQKALLTLLVKTG